MKAQQQGVVFAALTGKKLKELIGWRRVISSPLPHHPACGSALGVTWVNFIYHNLLRKHNMLGKNADIDIPYYDNYRPPSFFVRSAIEEITSVTKNWKFNITDARKKVEQSVQIFRR